MKIRNLVAGLALAAASAGAFATTTTFSGSYVATKSDVSGAFSDSWIYTATEASVAGSQFSTANVIIGGIKLVDIADPLLSVFKDGSLVATTSTPTSTLWTNLDANSTYKFVLSGLGDGKAGVGNYSFGLTISPVPEPETYALMGLGLVALVAARSRRRKA